MSNAISFDAASASPLNPYTGQVLDTVNANTEFMFVASKLHSLVYFGDYASYVIEAVGGLALILVVTGFYLWWPRKQAGGVVTVRGTSRQRIWWRDVHAVAGAFAGIVIFFLAATGMRPGSSGHSGIAAAALGLVFPITGAAILLMLAVDLLAIRSFPPLRRAFA